LLSTIIIFLFLTLWRVLFIRFGSIAWPVQRILILGTGEMALTLARNLEKYREKHLNLVGFVEMNGADNTLHKRLRRHAPVHGSYANLSKIITETSATRLIVASPARSREIIALIALAEGSNVTIDIVPDVYEILLASTGSIVGDIPLIHATGKQLSGYGLVPKKIFDLVLGIIFIILGSPIMLFAAIAIKLDDGGPVVYLQERVGKNGKIFNVVKFRTMQLDAEKSTGPVLAEDDDPRITAVGKALRRLRIDEMPQILNVLRGQMSFIGPRPERPFFVNRFREEIEGYNERQRVLPGITGLAQINGGYATTPQLKLKYDLMYVYHQSFLLDLQVIAETIKVVLTGRGAR
jgi:exopolysaccharide biosynthesis polyprenyl glycosylphosphotransferase